MTKCMVGDAAEMYTLVNFIRTTFQTDINAILSENNMSLTQGHMAETQRSVEEMVDETSQKSKQEADVSDLREMEEYLRVLEQRCENLDCRLKDQKVLHEMDMRALERERVQERAEWEKRSVEDLLALLMTVAIRREKLMSDLRKRQGTSGAERNPPTQGLHERFWRWLYPILSRMLLSHQGSPWVHPSSSFGGIRLLINNAHSIYEGSRRGIQGALRARALKRITKQEERERESEEKQLKVKAIAKVKAKKVGNHQNFSGDMRWNEVVGSHDMEGITEGFGTGQPASSQSRMSFFRRRKEAKSRKPLAKE